MYVEHAANTWLPCCPVCVCTWSMLLTPGCLSAQTHRTSGSLISKQLLEIHTIFRVRVDKRCTHTHYHSHSGITIYMYVETVAKHSWKGNPPCSFFTIALCCSSLVFFAWQTEGERQPVRQRNEKSLSIGSQLANTALVVSYNKNTALVFSLTLLLNPHPPNAKI